jgi:hypothetical protein
VGHTGLAPYYSEAAWHYNRHVTYAFANHTVETGSQLVNETQPLVHTSKFRLLQPLLFLKVNLQKVLAHLAASSTFADFQSVVCTDRNAFCVCSSKTLVLCFP